jgi:hypothetical protein
MHNRINFEDNIFILNVRIRAIRDMLSLDADPGFFLETTLNDLEFIDATLAALLDSLNNNRRYIEREEQFHNLLETERSLFGVLQVISSGDGTVSAGKFPEIKDRISLIQTHSLNRRKMIEGTPLEDTRTMPVESWVSRDELSELLKDIV